MKSQMIIVAAIALSSTVARAQSPAPEPDTLKDVKQTDPELKVPPRGHEYRQDHDHVSVKELPITIQATLRNGQQYLGWEKAKAYKSKTGNDYIVEITRNDTTRTFRFDKTGKPLKE